MPTVANSCRAGMKFVPHSGDGSIRGGAARGIVFALFAATVATPAAADVAQASDTGFTVTHKLAVAAPPAQVWQALIRPGLWWDGAHTYGGDAANLTLDPRAGGCWCEKLATGGVEHMRVVYIAAPTMLRMAGALGPLQAMAVTGVMTIELKPAGATTDVTFIYAAAGTNGLGAIAPAVDGVLAAQWARLKATAEKTPR